MFPLWLLGCIISLAGSVGAIVGTTIQKISFRHNDGHTHSSTEAAERRVYWKQKRWLMGLGLVVIGGFTDFASLSMTPQSTIAALGSMPLAANVPLAHYWLHEPVSKRDLVGTALIVLGSTLSVVFGDHSDTTYTSKDLQDLYKEIPYIIYGACIVGCMIFCYLAVRYLTPLRVKLVEAIDAYRVAEAEDQLDEAEAARRAEEEAAQWCLISPEDVAEAMHTSLAPPGLLAQEAMLIKPALEDAPAPPEASESAVLLQPAHSHIRSSSAGGGGGGTEVAAGRSLSTSSNANTPSLGPSSSPLGLTLDSSFDSNGDMGASSSVRGAQRASTSVLSARAAVLDLEISYSPYRRVHPVFFCALSGIFGAQSLLFGKSVASLLATSMTKGEDQFESPLTYAFILALGACLLGQLHFFATALEFFDALFVVPVFKCFYLMLSTVGGALYFREVQNFDTRQWIFFPLGLVMNIAGVWVLSSRDMKLDQADPLDRAADAAISGGGEDALLAHIHETSIGAGAAFESMQPSASFQSKAGSLLGRSSLEDINIAPQDEIEQAAQQALLSNASENLLRNAVQIANEEAASASAHPDHHPDRVLLVTSPMAGVTLVASEMIASPNAPNSTSPPSPSRQPTQPLVGSTRASNGNESALRTSKSWVSADPAPLLAAAHLSSDDTALPRSASNVDPHGVLSPGSVYGGSMGVSMLSLPQHSNSLLARSARSPQPASATPYDRHHVLHPGSAMSYGSLLRTNSEHQASSLQPPMGSLARASSVTNRSVNLSSGASSVGAGQRNLPPRVSVPGSRRRPRSNAGAPAHPADILVQRGSLIYRQPSFTGQTPLDSSRMTPAGSRSASSSDANAVDAASGPGWGDSIPLYLTPTQASTFTVASPITNETYSMPRDHSIFAHTRSYLARLGSATGLLRGRTPSTAAGPTATSNSISPRHPNPYTAPQMRPPPPDAAAVHAARGLPFSAGAHGVSGGDSYRPNSSAGHLAAEEEQAWREAREHIASAQRRSAALDVNGAAGGGIGAPVALSSSVAATSYVPPSFLRQPLAQLMPQPQPPPTTDAETSQQPPL